jgi:hypothetical protein
MLSPVARLAVISLANNQRLTAQGLRPFLPGDASAGDINRLVFNGLPRNLVSIYYT